MHIKIPNLLLAFSLILWSAMAFAQSTIQGRVVEVDTKQPIAGVIVSTTNQTNSVLTGADGFFEIQVPVGQVTLTFSGNNVEASEANVDAKEGIVALGNISVNQISKIDTDDHISVITFDTEQDDSGESDLQPTSGILTASSDVFAWVSRFPFTAGRFRVRGYDSENETVYINGVPANDLDVGRAYWGTWGGLNDVTRNGTAQIGLNMADFSFGNVGGVSSIDTRASGMRKGTRMSYASSNRSYFHRLMATHSTGMMENGWAVTASASRRWAQESNQEGSFYDAYSYFLSIDKKLNEAHTLNLTGFGAPRKSAGGSAVLQEVYDLAGSNQYNPNWGYQSGKKRNARVGDSHQPMFILRHDWTMNENTKLITAVSYQFGKNGQTALDWYEGGDPRPDYYRKLPSFQESPEIAAQVEAYLLANPDALQLQWHNFYDVNRNNMQTITNVGGIETNTFTGNRSNFIIEERRYDSKEFNFNTNFEHIMNNQLRLNAGLTYQYYNGSNFKVVSDLLGGDFSVDVDKFAERDAPGGTDYLYYQNDVNNPNRILTVGDRFGYDYESNIHKTGGWIGVQYAFKKLNAFGAIDLSNTTFWRTGNYLNGRFQDNSFGDSEKQNFLNYQGKLGLTYKLDGRNSLYINGLVGTRAPFFRNAYVSPRTRDQVVDDLKSESFYSVEGGYMLKAPYAKIRITGYMTHFKDQFLNRSFFLDEPTVDDNEDNSGFTNYIVNGFNTSHTGIEFAGETKIFGGLSASAAVAYSRNIYTNRPSQSLYLDNDVTDILELLPGANPVYWENYHVSGSPEFASTFGLRYEGPNFWSINANINYFDGIWIDMFPLRRTDWAVSGNADPQTQEDLVAGYESVLAQTEVDPQFTVDVFARKSFKFGRYYMLLNVGVNNILNNTDFITGGFEQFRYNKQDPDRFDNRYYYGYGLNYFASLTFSID